MSFGSIPKHIVLFRTHLAFTHPLRCLVEMWWMKIVFQIEEIEDLVIVEMFMNETMTELYPLVSALQRDFRSCACDDCR